MGGVVALRGVDANGDGFVGGGVDGGPLPSRLLVADAGLSTELSCLGLYRGDGVRREGGGSP